MTTLIDVIVLLLAYAGQPQLRGPDLAAAQTTAAATPMKIRRSEPGETRGRSTAPPTSTSRL
jgi:hypothetical protein